MGFAKISAALSLLAAAAFASPCASVPYSYSNSSITLIPSTSTSSTVTTPTSTANTSPIFQLQASSSDARFDGLFLQPVFNGGHTTDMGLSRSGASFFFTYADGTSHLFWNYQGVDPATQGYSIDVVADRNFTNYQDWAPVRVVQPGSAESAYDNTNTWTGSNFLSGPGSQRETIIFWAGYGTTRFIPKAPFMLACEWYHQERPQLFAYTNDRVFKTNPACGNVTLLQVLA